MGKLEKVIVLSVLFLIAAILVVSLTVDDPLEKPKVAQPGARIDKPADAGVAPMAPTTPITSGNKPPVSAPATGAAPTPSIAIDSKPAAASPTTLLSANVTPDAASPRAGTVTIPAGSLLETSAGLQDSFMPDMKFYTWQAGDTFRSVAAKYYGDATRVTMLRRVNEDRYDVTPGEKILLPIFDLDAPAPIAPGGTQSLSPAAAASGSKSPVPAGTAPKSPAAAGSGSKSPPAAGSGARIHVVQEGESLWKIAKQELGAGARWNEIYEANRDVLSSPEALHTGLKLRMP